MKYQSQIMVNIKYVTQFLLYDNDFRLDISSMIGFSFSRLGIKGKVPTREYSGEGSLESCAMHAPRLNEHFGGFEKWVVFLP